MIESRITGYLRWIFSPIVYAAGAFLVLTIVWFVVVPFVERSFGCPACDAGALLGILVIGALIFAPLSAGLYRFEQIATLNVFDHVRHCILLYLLLGTLILAQLTVYGLTTSAGLAYAFGIVLFLGSVYGVLLDAMIFLVMRRRATSA